MDKEEIYLRLEEIQVLKNMINQIKTKKIEKKRGSDENGLLKDGINIIIPSYKGEKVILTCLNSLYNQTLDKNLFEIIIILNGEKDSSEAIINKFIHDKEMNNIKLLYSNKPSASNARNIGIKNATRKFTLFLDDDDYLSKNYLQEMYNNIETDTILVSQIVNVDEKGTLDTKTPLNNQIINMENNYNNTYQTLSMVATINACKLLPTIKLKGIKFKDNLKSGEDIVYFTELFVKYDFKFKVIPIKNEVIYYRFLRKNSISRQSITFDFNVKQRLDVIMYLNQLLDKTFNINKQIFIKQKIHAQASFINKYLQENIMERERVFLEIKNRNLKYVPYSIINKGLSKKLIIAYCFPPYADTSGNVMAKRLRYMNEIVDVIYNQMDKVRSKDYSLNLLVDDLISERFPISSYPSFSNWNAINDFCKTAMEKLIDKKKYSEIYSRVMWPGSHFLAYQYKLNHPKVKWVAEFSDPILLDIQGKPREAKITDVNFIKKANEFIWKKYNLPKVKNDNLFFWCEYLTYLFADELIFTNENQMRYMIDSFPIERVKKIIKDKAIISPQPSLPKEYYKISKSNYKIEKDKVNIAYFGTFYKTRNLDDLFTGFNLIEKSLKEELRIHIFTSNPEELENELKGTGNEKYIKVNPYVGYLEFLNLTTLFDCLVVNDASTKDHKLINPYLPSKVSDYIGSGSKVWGIYEKDSILSEYPLDYKSKIGNLKETKEVFNRLAHQNMVIKNVNL